jgi:hypothetical protein
LNALEGKAENGEQTTVENAGKISILQGMQLLVAAWHDDVKRETIANCFAHCKIRSVHTAAQEVPGCEEVFEDQELIKELEKQIHCLSYKNPMDICEFLDIPEEQQVTYLPTEEDIVRDIRQAEETGRADENEEEVDDNEEMPTITAKEADRMLDLMIMFLLQQEGDQIRNIEHIRQIKDDVGRIRTKKMVQTSLLSYFNPNDEKRP